MLRRSQKSVFVPVNTPWVQFRDNILSMVRDPAYDSVLVHVMDTVDRDMDGVMGNMSVKMNAIAGMGTRENKPVLSYESTDKPFYIANPTLTDMKEAGPYAPSDSTIMEKYNSYGSDDAWQEHQGRIWNRMKGMMPLSRKADKYNRDHASQLKDPKRGLEEKDLDKFWSFKAKQGLSPTIMGDDMVGMPSVEGREYDGFTMVINQPDGSVKVKPMQVRSLMTTGASGIMIPMANANGHVNKHQVAADLTPFGTMLHFRAEDGRTVAKGELYDRKTREYAFNFTDGTPTHVKVTDVAPDNTITMQDAHGIFNVKQKKELVDVLKERGYNVPGIITSIKAEQNGKYMWQSPGTMTGSDEVLKTVSPSNPGFIVARTPKNGEDKYVVLVAEGALKGHIVAKYVDVKDSEGICFGDKIAGNKGIIVTQVPGVAEAYVKNAVTIYDKYPVAGTYIAMDADGRENRNVAMGIHTAYDCINRVNPTTVLSWDPAQKGMDDALLAVAQGKITVEQMGITSGPPDKLFPLEGAHVMTPYKLDGTQTSRPSWVQEYEDDKKARIEKVAVMQAATAERQAMAEKESMKWMKTPGDISSLKSVTVTKAAEMADAMAGKLPPEKPESRGVHVPDPDEAIAEDTPDMAQETGTQPAAQEPSTVQGQPAAKGQEGATMEGINEKILKLARDWDRENPAMPPIDVPEGYKSQYTYRQPVVQRENTFAKEIRQALPANASYDAQGRWGVISMKSDHEFGIAEKTGYREEFEKGGIICVGGMRLTDQSFTLDRENSLQFTDDDLPVENGSGRSI